NISALGTPASTNLNSTISTEGLGTFGQFGLGVAAQVVNTGWVSYLRGDYRKGDYIERWSVNGRLRCQVAPGRAVGGRGPVFAKAPISKAPPAQTAYNWNGFYVGAYLGADWGRTNWHFVDSGTSTDPHFAGLLGGGEIGYTF